MTDFAQCKAVLKAAALGDSETANSLYARLSADAQNDYNTYVIAMFATAMGVRFKDDQSLEAIRKFAAEMAYDFRDAEPPVKQLTIEIVLRAMMGEEHLFDEITAEEQVRIQLFAIRKVVDQTDSMKSELDKYLGEAESLAIHWSEED